MADDRLSNDKRKKRKFKIYCRNENHVNANHNIHSKQCIRHFNWPSQMHFRYKIKTQIQLVFTALGWFELVHRFPDIVDRFEYFLHKQLVINLIVGRLMMTNVSTYFSAAHTRFRKILWSQLVTNDRCRYWLLLLLLQWTASACSLQTGVVWLGHNNKLVLMKWYALCRKN